MGQKRFRIRQEFWLNVAKPDELELADLIDDLKRGRVFSQAIRDGLRLVVDLWRGNLDVLLELFPWVEEVLYNRFLEAQPAPEQGLQDQLAKLERLLIEQGYKPVEPVAAASAGPKPLAVSKAPAPVIDDDLGGVELVVKKAKSDGRASQNFLDSAFNLLR